MAEDGSKGWKMYSSDISRLLDSGLTCEVQSGPAGGSTYAVNVREGFQVKKSTDWRRNVRRVVWEWQSSDGREGAYTYAEALVLEQAWHSLYVDETQLQYLLDMGYTPDVAHKALLAFNHRLDRAVDALLSGTFKSADAPGQPGMEVKVNGDRRFVIFSQAGMSQRGPMKTRKVQRREVFHVTAGNRVKWEVLADEGWREYDDDDARVLETAYTQQNKASMVDLGDHEVDVKGGNSQESALKSFYIENILGH